MASLSAWSGSPCLSSRSFSRSQPGRFGGAALVDCSPCYHGERDVTTAPGSPRKYEHSNPAAQEGYTPLPNAVLRDPTLSGLAKATYALLQDFSWQKIEPEIPEVAALLGVGEKVARKALRDLETAGLVTSTRRGLGLSNSYEIHEPTMPNGEKRNGHIDRSGTADTDVPSTQSRLEVQDLDLPPIVPPSLNGRIRQVNRVPVTDPEYELASDVLDRFNEAAGTAFRSDEWRAKIILRAREYPDLTADDHEHVIRRALADPWWSGAASPSVVYGNGAQFERCVQTVATNAPRKVLRRYGIGMTAAEIMAGIGNDELGELERTIGGLFGAESSSAGVSDVARGKLAAGDGGTPDGGGVRRELDEAEQG